MVDLSVDCLSLCLFVIARHMVCVLACFCVHNAALAQPLNDRKALCLHLYGIPTFHSLSSSVKEKTGIVESVRCCRRCCYTCKVVPFFVVDNVVDDIVIVQLLVFKLYPNSF